MKSWPFEQKDKSINVEFPSDRHGQIYESYLVSLRDRVIRLHMYSELSKDVQYCKVALDFLTVGHHFSSSLSAICFSPFQRRVKSGLHTGVL